MLSRNKQPQECDQFRIPYASIITWREYTAIYPSILCELVGDCPENTLQFYYSRSPLTSIYEFVDENAEHDIASIIGIDLTLTMEGETKDEMIKRKNDELNEDKEISIEEYSLIIEDGGDYAIKKNEKALRKQEKKERRAKKLSEREEMVNH
jgi:hypothetical protein